jgi:hypothetical protein
MTLIIGFGHKARNGKDEAIKAIMAATPDASVKRYGFGDALKNEVNVAVEGAISIYRTTGPGTVQDVMRTLCCEMAGVAFDADPPMDDPLCPYGKQRALLQWWGTEFRRAKDPDYWVKKTMQQIAEDAPDVALICDLRFPNEAEGIRAAGGYIVRVRRMGYVSDVPQHVSETALDGYGPMSWDACIDVPDGCLELLQEGAVNVFRFLQAVQLSLSAQH